MNDVNTYIMLKDATLYVCLVQTMLFDFLLGQITFQ